jgi:hypothetical protein
MKLNVFAFTLAANAVGALGANAQTMIEERRDPAVVIEQDRPDRSRWKNVTDFWTSIKRR